MQRTGVQLAADGAAEYFATLDRVNRAGEALLAVIQPLVAALNRYDDQAGNAGKATADLAADTQPAEQAFHRLDTFAGDAGDAVLTMGKDSSKAASEVDDLGDSADRAGKESKDLGDDAETGAKGLSFMEQAAVGAARRLGELAVEGAQAAAQAIVDFTKEGIKAAGDFEGGMNTFAATVGGELDTSGQSLDDFKQLFISLGRDLPVSTAEVQQAAIEMSKGGIDPATIAAGGLRQALQFAAASGLGLADAAQISAKILQGWVPLTASAADKTAFFGHATDLLTKATTAAATNVDQLSLGLFNVQGAAHAAGVPLDDTVTTLALLTPSFNSSATAGDSMKNMLLSLIPKSTAAAGAMAQLGLLTKDGNSAFYDAKGHFIGMRATADKLQKALGGLSEAQRVEALRTIFGNDALNAANVLVQAGAKGYDEITKKIALQNGVAEQAAKKQQGFNVALDNMGGSLEALQITIFSAALPALTSLVNLVARGINIITDYADATIKGQTALAGIASFIGQTAIPVITGLTAAVTAWAIVQAVQATPAVLASIPAILAQTTAFITNAAAVAAALAPYALIAAAVAGVAFAYKGLQDQLASVTDRVLAGSQAWQNSVQALANYDAASEGAKTAAHDQAEALRSLQTEQRGAIEQYALHTAAYQQFGIASGQTAESLEQERLAINARGDAIVTATGALNDQVQAEVNTQAASMTATAMLDKMRSGTEDLGGQVHLTADEMEKFVQKIEDIRDKGGAALQGYATTQSEFLDGVEQRQAQHAAQIEELERKKQAATTVEQKQGIDDQIKQVNESYHDQEEAAAKSYARQQAEQKQHLGQMLIDYTVTQASLGNIGKDKAAEITRALEKEYGLQKSSVASTFLDMAGSIDKFAHSSNQDVSSLTATLHDQQQQAADTQRAMDTYAKTYTATAVTNFVEKHGEAKDYIAALEAIPSEVQSIMKLPYINDREQEVRDFKRSIDDLPLQKTITINVRVNRPDDMIPGSPTPFEIALYGIADALDAVAAEAASMPDFFSRFGEGASSLLGIMQQIGDAAAGMFGDLASVSRQEAQNQRDLEQLAGSRRDAEEKLRVARREADRLAETDPEAAKKYYARESQQILELARLQDEMAEAREEGDAAHLASLQRQYAAIQQAQQLEDRASEAAAAGQPSDPISELFQRVNEAFNNLDITIVGDFPQFLTDLQHLISSLTHPPARATGGSVAAMDPYLVGERGPEMIVPDRDGYVLNAMETRQMLAAPSAGASSSNTSHVTNLYVSVSGSGVSYGDVVAGVREGLRAEGQDADVRIRTGVN